MDLFKITFTYARKIPAITALRHASRDVTGTSLTLRDAKDAIECGIIIAADEAADVLRIIAAAKREDSSLEFALTISEAAPLRWSHAMASARSFEADRGASLGWREPPPDAPHARVPGMGKTWDAESRYDVDVTIPRDDLPY